jgi:hypothetical protein
MGIRLYPKTNDKAKLERIAMLISGIEIAPGTTEKLKELEKQYPQFEELLTHLELRENEACNMLQAFLLNGFGRMRTPYSVTGDCGQTTTQLETFLMGDYHGLTTEVIELTEGFNWS